MNRITAIRCALWLIVVGVLVSSIGCGGGKYSSPEATFETSKAAAKNNDWKGVYACMTQESVDAMAGMMVFSGSMQKQIGSGPLAALAGAENAEKAKQHAQKIAEIFKRHGVSDDAMKSGALTPGKMPTSADIAKLGAGIADKPQFLADMMNAMQESADEDDKKKMLAGLGDATLKDVEIDGDAATGTVTSDGKDRPMKFKKVGGEWKIEIALMGGA